MTYADTCDNNKLRPKSCQHIHKQCHLFHAEPAGLHAYGHCEVLLKLRLGFVDRQICVYVCECLYIVSIYEYKLYTRTTTTQVVYNAYI